MSKLKLSTHVLDTSSGKPAGGMFVTLYKQKGDQWVEWHGAVTTPDGRVQFPFSEESLQPALYKLKFNIEKHYRRTQVDTFYPYAEVVFAVKAGQHYHVPLLLSPHGYTTYRGS